MIKETRNMLPPWDMNGPQPEKVKTKDDAREVARLMKEAVKAAKGRVGHAGWTILGPQLRQALVRGEVLRILGMWATIEDTLAGKLATAGVRWDEEQQ
jgi:hypothetical protein